MAFSGSAVVDHGSTSGFGSRDRPPLVAIHTGHRNGHQDQRLAWSADRVMAVALAAEHRIAFYSSPDLQRWVARISLARLSGP